VRGRTWGNEGAAAGPSLLERESSCLERETRREKERKRKKGRKRKGKIGKIKLEKNIKNN